MRTLVIAIAVIIVLGGGIWYFVSKNNGTTNSVSNTNTVTNTRTNTNALNTNTAVTNSNTNTTAAVDYSITATEYAFSPAELIAAPGQTLRVQITNNGTMQHNFVIDALNVNSLTIAPGESKTVTFTVPDAVGTYQYYCSIANHRALGMFGTLKVQTQ